MPGGDRTIELQDLSLQHPELGTQRDDTSTCERGQPFIARISGDPEELFNAVASDRCDDAELSQMRADGIDHRGLLADKQVTGTVQRQTALLFNRFGRDEPHVRSGDRFADRLRVCGIILMALDVGLHIGRRHQANSMPERRKFARPMMRRCASLDADQTPRQLLKEREHRPTLQLPADDYVANRIDAVDLEYRLGNVETDCRDRLHG